MFGGAGFIAVFVVAHLVQPTVDPSWQPPSELALGATGWVMTTAFLLLAAASVGLFLALTSQAVTWPGRIGLAAVLLAATGFVVAAIFPTDPATTPPGEMTLTGTLHSIGPVLADGIPIAAVILAVSLTRHSPQWRRVRWVLVLGAVLTVWAAVLLTVSLAVLMPETGRLGPDVPVGWQGRFLLAADAVWLAAVGGCALAIRRGAAPGASDISAPTLSGRAS
ncbi:hypothetical protein GCM10009749_12640 [Agromyces neolithicus]|uniref:DUF998 domain-containing protein n=1 Tax=Agromyces neolithicus TaxID=269420 RepID=A0ABN2M252_9MICO